jgi:transaldolase
MQRCLDGVGTTTRLLVASLRSPEDILTLAPLGVDTYTLSPSLVQQIWNHPLTEEAAARFETDARTA